MADLESLPDLHDSINANVTTNAPLKQNTGARVNELLNDMADTLWGHTDAGISAHTVASDPHGDRAYAEGQLATKADISSLGTAAAQDIAAFDAAGAATAAVSAHVAASDPHTQYQKESEKGAANGYAALDGSGQIPAAQIPAIAITDYLGASANQAAMLALVGQKGDWTTRTDLGTMWIITGTDPSVLGDWTAVSYPASPVSSVAGRTGDVVLSKSDVALGSVDNTADVDKVVSTPQAAATIAAINAEVTNRNNAIAAATAGLVDDRGTYDASTDLFPTTGGSGTSGAVMRGDQWQISVKGTLGSGDVNPGDIIRALTDSPAQVETNWFVDAVIQKVAGGEEDNPDTTDDKSYMTPVRTFLAIAAARSSSVWKAAVRGTVLSGFTAVTAAPVTNAKTVEEAITLLQAQVDLLNTVAGSKWYRAVISQTGTSAPTAGGLAGSFGVTYARATTGSYTLTAGAGIFVANKTRVYITNGTSGTATQVQASRATATVVGVTSKDSSGTLIDGGLTDCSIWIIVEP